MHLLRSFRKTAVVAVVAFALVAPATASADWIFTPFIGGNAGGDTEDTNLNFGGSLAWMGAGIAGFEVDFGYAPDFFDRPDLGGIDVDDSNVTTLMGNLVLGAPIETGRGSVRPYASAGVGLLRSNISDPDDFFDVDNNSFGMNVGAGVMGFFNENVGLRGDVRYFRSLTDPEEDNEFDIDFGSFDFWRATVGVSFRW